jgi:AcrR family transcriptional regulator
MAHAHLGRKSEKGLSKEARRRETTRRLLDAARRMFSEKGYENVSVTEIARAAGVSHGMIHAYFHSKAGLLYEIIAEGNEDQIRASEAAVEFPGSFLERLDALVAVWAQSDLADPKLLGVMQSYFWVWPADVELENRRQLDRNFGPLRLILKDGIASGELRADLSVPDAVAIIFAVYTQGLRDCVYAITSAEETRTAIMRKLALVVAGMAARP